MSNMKNYTKHTHAVIEKVDQFHIAYYKTHLWEHNRWLGISCLKNPFDLLAFQEIIWEVRPSYIIECGSMYGGTALFFATICEMIGRGHVIAIDLKPKWNRASHFRLTKIEGNTVDPKIVAKVSSIIKDKQPILVDLDSCHKYRHVLREMEIYSKFVTKGSYLIVEDTNVDFLMDQKILGVAERLYYRNGGPMRAVEEFISRHPEFEIDKKREPFLTFNQKGYLRAI